MESCPTFRSKNFFFSCVLDSDWKDQEFLVERWIWNESYVCHCTSYAKVSYTNLNRKWIHESCFWIFIESHFHEIFCPLVFALFSAKLYTSNTDCILQGDLSNSKSIWHLSLKFDALWCRVCSAKIRAIFPANYFSKPGVQINFSVMTNPRKLSLLCCRRSSRLTWRPEARRY